MEPWFAPCVTRAAIGPFPPLHRSATPWTVPGARRPSANIWAKSEASERLPILVDQGDRDDFLEKQLKPQALERAAAACDYPLTLRMQPGYDHSYYFIATFIEDHLRHHAQALLD